MNPNDYTSAFAGLPDPSTTFMQGVQNGAGIQQLQLQQQQAATAQQQQAQMQADLAALSQNPTTQAIGQMSIKYPQLSESFKRSFDMVEPSQRQARLDQGVQVYSALHNKQPEIAIKLLNDQAEAQRNSGNEQDAKAAETMAELIKVHPEFAQTTAGLMLASALGPDKFTAAFPAIGAEQRADQQAPEDLRKAKANADTAEGDATVKNLAIVGQQAGALAQAKGVKPAQAQAMFKSLAARGVIGKDQLQGYLDDIPADPAALPAYLKQVQASGMKPDDQMKFTTPDANTVANNANQVKTTGMNNSTQLAVQDRIDARAKAESDGADDVASFTPQAIDNAAARYNLDGTLPPMGMGKAASAGRTLILNRAAELKAGVDPEQQRRDQLNVKGQQKAVQEFTSGKLGNSVRSFNVGISHLDTLGTLADALDNKDTQAFNRIGNYFATQTGSTAPTSFNAAKKIVGDEIVKAIVGAGGGVHDREEAAKVIDAANSPAQLKAAISTYKELMIGQLGGLERQYQTSTGRTDFERFLSPQAQTLRRTHAPAGATAQAPAIPAGWSVKER